MSTVTTSPFKDIIDPFTALEMPRVWSLIVTVFGDLAQGEDDLLRGSVLSAISGSIGIRPEAMRVAIHRLRKDGWLQSHPSGRSTKYALTSEGRKQSVSASPRIYAQSLPQVANWHGLVSNPSDADSPMQMARAVGEYGYFSVSPTLSIGIGRQFHHPSLFEFDAKNGNVASWLKDATCPADVSAQYQLLSEILAYIRGNLDNANRLSTIEAATLRVLIVHSWRRIVLRHPDLPINFFPEDWPGTTCRALVHETLGLLPRPSVEALNRAI
ncbi:MAG: phenylacetic acid degradation operon negative regulatory protein [Paracoccaceae bacterium]|jgi:phenylacetic acid degradation operon negative regulatory protein